jgi:hypothetical protein
VQLDRRQHRLTGKQRLKYRVVLLAAFLGICGAVSQAERFIDTAKKKTVCELAEHPKHLNRKLVAVFGHFEQGGAELDSLSDPSCEGKRVGAYILLGAQEKYNLAMALAKGRRGTADKMITATFVGVFHWNPAEQPASSILVMEIEGMKSGRRTQEDPKFVERSTNGEVQELADNAPEKTDVCALTSDSERFSGRPVTFLGFYESDGIENTLAMDPACKGVGVGLTFVRETQGMEVLDAALRKGLPGTLDKTVTATFVGIFLWKPKQVPSSEVVVTAIQGIKSGPKSVEDPIHIE